MNIILFDTIQRGDLFPFTYTKPVGALRAGVFTNLERWQKITGIQTYAITVAYLQPQWGLPVDNDNIMIDARILPDTKLVETMMNLQPGEALVAEDALIAGRTGHLSNLAAIDDLSFTKHISYASSVKKILYPWHLFQLNDHLLRNDIALLTAGNISAPLSATNQVINAGSVFIEDGAVVECCILNAATGPVYIGKNATIMEGSMIRGPFAAGEGSVVKMGTKIYGATSVGPYCTVGGEIKNAVMMAYSNKAHDGYLGDSVIGEWCNLGAGTSNSNVRNDAGAVLFANEQGSKKNVGLKCGLLMGDYTRAAINTSFNTGTFAGIASGIFGQGLAPKYLPNFTWGYTEKYRFDKAVEHISNWKKLKQQELSDTDIQILEHLYKQTE